MNGESIGSLIGVVLPLFFLVIAGFWVYAILSVITNDFKKDVNKLVWLALLIFIPISFPLYFKMKKDLLIPKEDKNAE